MPIWLQTVLGMVLAAVATGTLALVRRVMRRLDRDESLRADYPPHRHINGKILYPKEYEPAAVEQLQGSGG